MRFSVIMPCRLIPYPGCASQADLKLKRAIRSVLNQSFTDFELIVIADGCEKTKEIVKTFKDERIVLLEVEHKAIFGNLPRNTGIDNAKGDYIIYCDADDYWGSEHLAVVNKGLGVYDQEHELDRNLLDWVWYNDIIFQGEWIERSCNVKVNGQCGTSNVCHKRSLGVKWGRPGYAHDYYFIQQLLMFNGTKIETPEYFVCHILGKVLSGNNESIRDAIVLLKEDVMILL